MIEPDGYGICFHETRISQLFASNHFLIWVSMTQNYLDRLGIESLRYENLDQSSWYKNNRELIDEVYDILYDQITSALRPYYGYFLLRGVADRMKSVKDGGSKREVECYPIAIYMIKKNCVS